MKKNIIKKTLSKETRHLAYTRALDIFERYHKIGMFPGVCTCLIEILPYTNEEIFKRKLFPELMRYKPMDFPISSQDYWWRRDDYLSRVNALLNCIDATR